MRSPAVPFTVLLVVAAAMFALAHVAPVLAVGPDRRRSAAGRCGPRRVRSTRRPAPDATAPTHTGGVGPALRGSGLTADDVEAVVATGRGTMPAGLVSGQDLADVSAYVATLSE